MINTADILFLCYLKLCLNQLVDMDKRYWGNTGVSFLIGCPLVKMHELFLELNHKHTGARFSQADPSLVDERPSDEAILDLLPALKNTLSAADYLFLKAIHTEDELDMAFLFAQAHMIEPENLRFPLMRAFSNEDQMEDLPLFVEQLLSLPLHSRSVEIEHYIGILRILTVIDHGVTDITVGEAATFFNYRATSEFIRMSLLWQFTATCSPEFGLGVLKRISPYSQKNKWLTDLARASCLYRLDDFESVLDILLELDSEDIPHYKLATEMSYMTAIAYRETGKQGRYIMILMDMVNDSEDITYSNSTLMAAVDLASYYLDMQDISNADRVLDMFPPGIEDYMNTLTDQEFNRIMMVRTRLGENENPGPPQNCGNS